MSLSSYLELKNEISITILLIIFSFAVRLPVIFIFGDVGIENEWTPLLSNLINYKTLSVVQIENFGFLLPNLLMPPLYGYYLYFFSLFNLENQIYIQLILFSQVFLAAISIGLFYRINRFFFTKIISFYSSLLFSLLPIYLYACSQISSASLTIFLALFFYYFFLKITKNKNIINIFLFAVIGGLLILVRREFTLILFLSSIYLFFFSKISLKNLFLIFLIATITLSPYLIRNYIIFDKIILHSGFGYNLWKGNNENSIVEGSDKIPNQLKNKVDAIPKNKFYRINEDKIYLHEALSNIKANPTKYFILYIKRTVSYFFIDLESSNTKYYNPFHYIPILLLAITSMFGIVLSNKKSYLLNYFILILLFYILVFSFFAILPRYKLYIIPMQIILSNVLIENMIKKIKFNKKSDINSK